jgi:hypothetical protein
VKQRIVRISVLLLGIALLLSGAIPLAQRALAKDAAPAIAINIDNAAPRPVEEATQKALSRDYSAAWEALLEATRSGKPSVLSAGFVGAALDKLKAGAEERKANNLKLRYIDHGHKVDALFYSIDGSAVQLRDTAKLEMQVLDGDDVIHSETGEFKFISIMTVVDNRWRVRMMEQQP